jgi:hypothetical protein
MMQQEVVQLTRCGAGGERLCAYRFRTGGHDSTRVQHGGLASEQDEAACARAPSDDHGGRASFLSADVVRRRQAHQIDSSTSSLTRRGPKIPLHELKRAATNRDKQRAAARNRPRTGIAHACAYAHTYASRGDSTTKSLQIGWAGQVSNLRPWD